MASERSGKEMKAGARLRVMWHALLFSIGFSTLFIIMGATTGLVGRFFIDYRFILQRVAGAFIVMIGIYMTGILEKAGLPGVRGFDVTRFKLAGPLGSILVGFIFSFSCIGCIGPVFGAILALALTQSSLTGFLMSVAFSLGLALPLLVIALFISALLPVLIKVNKYLDVIQKSAGIFLILFGLAVLTGWISSMTAWLAPLAVQQTGLGTVSIPLAFIGGVVSLFSPCFFPLIPAYLSFLSGVSVVNSD